VKSSIIRWTVANNNCIVLVLICSITTVWLSYGVSIDLARKSRVVVETSHFMEITHIVHITDIACISQQTGQGLRLRSRVGRLNIRISDLLFYSPLSAIIHMSPFTSQCWGLPREMAQCIDPRGRAS